ncbi:hypothetical protein FRC03_012311 [Tulasnella sp. 419]|nr:hypothetical protein FRC03_012311 [Tulasnella sp. 419]
MRRTQTARHTTRPSVSNQPDDLGVIRDPQMSRTMGVGGKSSFESGRASVDSQRSYAPRRGHTTSGSISHSGDSTVNLTSEWDFGHDNTTILGESEEVAVASRLREELMASEREREKLNNLVASLQAQLAARPPLAQVQKIKDDFHELELLLQGTLRENERCMGEIEKGRRRERLLETELARLVGDNWMETLNLGAELNPSVPPKPMANASPISAARTLSHVTGGHSRRPSLNRTYSIDTSSPKMSPSLPTHTPDIQSIDGPSSPTAEDQKQRLLTHMEQIRALILGMDQKLRVHDEKLAGMVEVAKNEERKYEQAVNDINKQLSTAAR